MQKYIIALLMLVSLQNIYSAEYSPTTLVQASDLQQAQQHFTAFTQHMALRMGTLEFNENQFNTTYSIARSIDNFCKQYANKTEFYLPKQFTDSIVEYLKQYHTYLNVNTLRTTGVMTKKYQCIWDLAVKIEKGNSNKPPSYEETTRNQENEKLQEPIFHE